MIKRSRHISLILLALLLISISFSTEVFAVKSKVPTIDKKPGGKEIYFARASTEEISSSISRAYAVNTYILTTNNDLFGFGTNKFGQLGKKGIQESETIVKIMSDVKSFHTFQEENLYYVIKTNGELWGWGENLDGIIGCGKKGIIRKPVKILDNVATIHETGRGEYYALTENKELYIWGKRYPSFKVPQNNKPTKILDGVTTFDIGLYPYISYAIVNENELWTWGRHSGSGNNVPSEKPKPTKIMDNVDGKVYTEDYLFYVINKNGELWGWTSSSDEFNDPYLVMGIGKKGPVPKPEKILDNVAEVFPDYDGTKSYALKKNGELWGWGGNYDGSLGNGKKGAVLKPIKVIDGVSKFLSYYGSCYVIRNKGELWAWGYNGISPIGDGTFNNQYYGEGNGSVVSEPKKIMSGVKHIDGPFHCTALMISPLIIKDNDELWGWGNHLDGGYTYSNELSKYPLTPRKLKENVAYGGYDLAGLNRIVTKNNELWEWGTSTNNLAIKTADNYVAGRNHFWGSGEIKENGDVYIYGNSKPIHISSDQFIIK